MIDLIGIYQAGHVTYRRHMSSGSSSPVCLTQLQGVSEKLSHDCGLHFRTVTRGHLKTILMIAQSFENQQSNLSIPSVTEITRVCVSCASYISSSSRTKLNLDEVRLVATN